MNNNSRRRIHHNGLGSARATCNSYIKALTMLIITLVCYTWIASQLAQAYFIQEGPQWDYSHQNKWHLQHKKCNKNAQSPIDIQRGNVIANNQLKLHFYNYNQLTRFKIQNAHHTIKMTLLDEEERSSGLRQTSGRPQPTLSRLNQSAAHSSRDSIEAGDEMLLPDNEIVGQESETLNGLLRKSLEPAAQEKQERRKNATTQSVLERPSSVSGSASAADETANEKRDQVAGTTAETGAPPGSVDATQAYNGVPSIKLDWLDDGNNEFKLQEIHFHWGDRRDNGSEHAIDGKRSAMEMHLVHIKHGLDKSAVGFTSDSLTVIAVLIESYRKSNADFNPIVNALSRVNASVQTQNIEYKSINDLLPNILTSFYVYSGSLTTPPCHQVVNWIIMSDRLYLNAKQIEMFRNMYSPPAFHNQYQNTNNREQHRQKGAASSFNSAEGSLVVSAGSAPEAQHSHLIMPNIRSLQAVNNRTILASFSPLSRIEQIQAGHYEPFSGASSVWHINHHITMNLRLLAAITVAISNTLITSRHLY